MKSYSNLSNAVDKKRVCLFVISSLLCVCSYAFAGDRVQISSTKSQFYGEKVYSAGADLNGDGFTDYAVLSAQDSSSDKHARLRFRTPEGNVSFAQIRSPNSDDGFGSSFAYGGKARGSFIYAIGAGNTDSKNGTDSGAVYVVSYDEYRNRFRIHKTINGDQEGSNFGFSVAPYGEPGKTRKDGSLSSDADGDGYPDFFVGAPGYDKGKKSNVGKVVLISGLTGETLDSYTPNLSRDSQTGYGIATVANGDPISASGEFSTVAVSSPGASGGRGLLQVLSWATADQGYHRERMYKIEGMNDPGKDDSYGNRFRQVYPVGQLDNDSEHYNGFAVISNGPQEATRFVTFVTCSQDPFDGTDCNPHIGAGKIVTFPVSVAPVQPDTTGFPRLVVGEDSITNSAGRVSVYSGPNLERTIFSKLGRAGDRLGRSVAVISDITGYYDNNTFEPEIIAGAPKAGSAGRGQALMYSMERLPDPETTVNPNYRSNEQTITARFIADSGVEFTGRNLPPNTQFDVLFAGIGADVKIPAKCGKQTCDLLGHNIAGDVRLTFTPERVPLWTNSRGQLTGTAFAPYLLEACLGGGRKPIAHVQAVKQTDPVIISDVLSITCGFDD